MLSLLLAALVSLPPVPAAWVASFILGRPEAAPMLVRICWRESRCTRQAAHPRDAGMGPAHVELAVRSGALRPQECSAHRGDPRRFSTRGAWGTAAAYVLRHLPWPLDCLAPPEILDVPFFGALAAVEHLDGRHPSVRRWAGS